MGEKKCIKITFGNLVMIILLIVVGVLSFLTFTFYNEKTKANNEVADLKNQVAKLQDSINNKEVTDTVSKEDTNETKDTNEVKKVKKIDDEKEIVYTSDNEITSENSYSIPAINIDSADAKKINEEISTKFAKKVGYAIKYVSYTNDNVLSLIIANEFDGGSIEYTVYNIDIYSGKSLSYKDLLKMKNVTETTYLEKLKEAYKNKYISMYGTKESFSKNMKSGNADFSDADLNREVEFYQKQYDKTIADNNISTESPLYLNSNGKLCNIGRIYSLAGGDSYMYEIELDV